ncbi:MAG: heavy metal translocating P-type ATPase [Ruminococcus sp.]
MTKVIFDIKGMSCSACSSAVQNAVSKRSGVIDAQVNLLTNTMTAEFDENVIGAEDIINAVKAAGYGASIKSDGEIKDIGKGLDTKAKKIKLRLILSAVFLALLMVVSMGHMVGINIFTHDQHILKGIVELALTVPIIVLNFKYFTSGFKALFKLNPNMDSLIAIGSAASIIYSLYLLLKGGEMHYYFESAGMILTFITIGKYLESKSKAKTTGAITKLMDLSPKTSIVLIDGEEVEIDSKDIKPGDTVIVKNGMNFPADGVVTNGNGVADESAITGESIPVEKTVGQKVTGGTLLLSGYLQFKAQKVGADTTLSGIIKLVEEATLTKPKIARLADKISRVFVPAVILIAVVTTVLWYIFTKDFSLSLNFGISVLVISCPCALGLATPTAIMVGTGRAAELGILVKSAEIFETGGKIKTVMFDKTGTITTGNPQVIEVISEHRNTDILMSICSLIESMSDHPLAQAVVKYKEPAKGKVEDYASDTGKGVSGRYENKEYRIGNRSYVNGKQMSETLRIKADEMTGEGFTVLFVSEDEDTVAIIGIADTIKDNAREAMKLLNSSGVETVMLTGDNKNAAEHIKSQAGIKEARAELLPADKNRIIKEYQQASPTAMVGDGINDSPALAAADLGIALGAGTDIAIESADVVLIKNDLRDVYTTLHICRKVMKNIKENLFWALIYNSIGIPIAAGVLYIPFGIQLSPMLGTIAMSLSSICVVTNALRLKKIKREYIPEKISKTEKEKKMKTVYIEGMMCAHCEARVKGLLAELDPAVEVSQKDGVAKLKADISDEKIKSIIEDAGYKVVNIE